MISFDAYTQIVIGSGSSQTLAHTCSGSDRVLVVSVLKQSNQTPTGVTYGGVAMTKVCELNLGLASGGEHNSLWILENPATGSNNIVATFTGAGTSGLAAGSYNGAKQSGQPDSSNALGITPATTNHTISLTTIADNCWLIGYFRKNGGTYTAQAGTTFRETGFTQIKFADSNGAKSPAGTYSLGATSDTSLTADTLILAIEPVGGGGAPTQNSNFLAVL